ncbi:hypothetical protein NE237_030015 [Protea cynaroides]|uniref:Sulfotransferase n=1 Tax=Protea cynaroides TaxID=273540 RepID=A0A9Q0GV02_9MAGN|nr:hypothetical protein NE237_030015 [Protea cynaroides]
MEITKSLLMATSNSLKPLLDELPRVNWWGDFALYQWEGFWYVPRHLEGAIEAQSHFKAHDADVILASSMKTGTTWTKALVTCIMNRPCEDSINGTDEAPVNGDPSKQLEDPLVTKNPSAYVKTLEIHLYKGDPTPPDLSGIPSPRLFHTYMPYKVMPESIKNSECKIVYVTRNPKDTFVSLWHFMNSCRTAEQGPFPIEEAFESFCNGIHAFGPFFDHVIEYWNESFKRPEKLLMLKYEELKIDPRREVKRLSSFLGKPLMKEEEIDHVLWNCSIDRLKNLDINKNGIDPWIGVANSSFFRLGAVGDWKNYFTSEMKERLDQLTRQKLQGSGVDLEI